MLYLAIDQHRKQLTVNLRNEQGDVLVRVPGTVNYQYDSAGRLSEDQATALDGWGDVDHAVQDIVTAYDNVGRVESVTSYADTSQTTPVNQVQYAYDGWGNLAQEWQAHDGLVATGTPSVQYGYDDGYETSSETSRPASYVRLKSVTYPNGREIDYNYAAGVDNVMSRLSATYNDANHNGDIDSGEDVFASYKYLGLGQIVEEDDGGDTLTYLDSNGNLTGLDRFGRVVDQVWKDASNNPIDEYTYVYDPAGNVTSKTNVLKTDHSLDQRYTYDALNRLIESDLWDVQGQTWSVQETWTLDALGNDLSSGTGGTYNLANEETPTVGGSAYDAAGNMTTLQSGKGAVYDAWNRLVKVTTGSGENLTTVQGYEYDGTNRRIQIFSSFDGNLATVEDDYLSGQQVVESRTRTGYDWVSGSGGTAAGGYQYLWSPRYIDAPVLRDTLNTAGTAILQAERVFYLADANYNVTGLVKQVETEGGPEWQVVERYTYTPYGEVTYRDAATGCHSRLRSPAYSPIPPIHRPHARPRHRSLLQPRPLLRCRAGKVHQQRSTASGHQPLSVLS